MTLDRSTLHVDEREQLRLGLLARKQHLTYRVTMQPGTVGARDASWQLFIVDRLLTDLGEK